MYNQMLLEFLKIRFDYIIGMYWCRHNNNFRKQKKKSYIF